MSRQQSSRSAGILLTMCLLAVCSSMCAATRGLKAPGDVTSKTTIYLDPNGGVPPLSERIEKVQEDNECRTDLILAEAHCKANHDDECEEADKIRERCAEEAAKEVGEEVVAPCYLEPLSNYFLGTWCHLPPDSTKDGKYKITASAGGDRRRSLLSLVRWW